MKASLKPAVIAALCLCPSVILGQALPETPILPDDPPPAQAELPTRSKFSAHRLAPLKQQSPQASQPLDAIAQQGHLSHFGLPCGPKLTATPRSDATVLIRLSAPCHPFSVVHFSYEDLRFTGKLSMTGNMHYVLPALSEQFELTASFPDQQKLTAKAKAKNLQNYARVAVQWPGETDEGLVAAGKIYRVGAAFGQNGAVLQILSQPLDEMPERNILRLSLRTTPTEQTCKDGQKMRVRRVIPGEPAQSYGLIIAGSGCDAIGRNLELKNILQDLRLTSN